MTNDTKEDVLRAALTKMQDRFEDGMKWSSQATDHEKTLVKCNLNGFVGFLAKEAITEIYLLHELVKEQQKDLDIRLDIENELFKSRDILVKKLEDGRETLPDVKYVSGYMHAMKIVKDFFGITQ